MSALTRTCLALAALLPLAGAAQEETWISQRARAQLAMDPTLIPEGKGLLFVPAMSAGYREPNYQVLADGREVASAQTGAGVLLSPGEYELLVGSGTSAQMTRRPIEVRAGHTTLVRPWWSGLVINVMDETRTAVKESYELFDEDQENFGIGYGVEEERGEAVHTWLLKPGTYTVVRVGENVAAPRKFSIRLLPGELVQRNLIVDENGVFVGFYAPGYLQLSDREAARLVSRWELSMSPQFGATQNTAGEDRASLSFAGEIRNSTRYNSRRHFFDLRTVVEEGFTKEQGHALRKAVDEVEVRSTYILRLSRRLGPYLRGVLNSKLFATKVHFDAPQTVVFRNARGDVLETRAGIMAFTQSPSLYPLQLREGLGINSQLYRSYPLNVDLRLGIGARQTYNLDTYELSQDRRTATELRNGSSSGLEALIVTDARLGRHIGLDAEADLLMPEARADSWEFACEGRMRTFLTPYASMDIVAEIKRQKPLRRVQSAEQVLFRVLKFF